MTPSETTTASHFRLLLLTAMYENGGNTTHRFLDGHPELFVYPFESQLGTRSVLDPLSSVFPVKYRWPVFSLQDSPEQDYAAIIDEECKVRAKTPQVSKFRHMPFDFSDAERCQYYCRHVGSTGRSTGGNVAAFFRATFEAWKDYRRSGREQVYVGYSPIVVVDTERILADLPGARLLHVVRNPWSAYADTKKRPVPLSLGHYMLGWNLNQHFAIFFKNRFPDRVRIVRIEDVMSNPRQALSEVCADVGVSPADSLNQPSWNGQPLEEVYPWGTLRQVTPEINQRTAQELSDQERAEIRDRAWQYLDIFDYGSFL